MKVRNNRSGFTLIELIMVIVILSVLAVVALPNFFDFSGDARNSAELGVVGGVRAGIATYMANRNVQQLANPEPDVLDSVADATDCSNANPCFIDVLAQGGITDDAWQKVTSTTWTHNGQTYTYTPGAGNGTFLCTAGTCP